MRLPAAMNAALSVDHGTLALAALGGAGVSGSGTSAVQITGTLAAINATLAGSNVIYTPVTDYFDNDTLTMVTNDGGNTGIGGALTDTDTVAINLHTHLFGTPDDDEFILDILPPATSASTRSAASATPSRSTSAWSTPRCAMWATRSSSMARRATRC